MHLASPASPKDYLEKPIQTLKVGSLGTHNTLGLAKAKGAKYFLASTSEVYGDPQIHPQPETYWGHVNPVGPRGVYDEAKRFAEAMTMAYHRYHGLDVRIVRIFNVYGPRMRPEDGRVVSNFIVQALLGKPLTVYGEGSQSRSFCYVDDEIRGFLALLDGDETGPINIGNDGEFTVRELANLVLELTGPTSEIVYEPLPVDDPTQRQPDLTPGPQAPRMEPTILWCAPVSARTILDARERLRCSDCQVARFSASSRWPRYQSTVSRSPCSKVVRGMKPNSCSARVASTRRRGCPSGF